MRPAEEWASHRRRVGMPVLQRGELVKQERVLRSGSLARLSGLARPGLGAVERGVEDDNGAEV